MSGRDEGDANFHADRGRQRCVVDLIEGKRNKIKERKEAWLKIKAVWLRRVAMSGRNVGDANFHADNAILQRGRRRRRERIETRRSERRR